ncbi:hypothetical protein [Arthrobacter sp. H5]|uniref:hypothetical protein n=1 Tax=Arthrobacter sp. H5 TaxID=1267973 RepID=UPI0004BCC90F
MDNGGAVTVTSLGDWPGTDPLEACRMVRGELGAPHLPFLAELPGRGPGSDAVGRTASLLEGLPVDLQPHGWRLVDRQGQDLRRAVSALSTDINVLGDVAGAEELRSPAIKVHLRGPLSMAANLYLHSGERALADHGARRDIRDSLAGGAASLVRRVQAAVPGAAVHVQIDEPEIAEVLGGGIPTASGYRTLRSVPEQEAADSWDLVTDAVRGARGADVVLSFGQDAPLKLVGRTGVDGIALPLAGLSTSDWEVLAGLIEAGCGLWAGILPAVPEMPQVSGLVDAVVRPWRGIGLSLKDAAAIRITPAGSLAGLTPEKARLVLGRLDRAADALNQVIADA